MIESSKVVFCFLFLLSSRSWVDGVLGGTIYAKPFFFVVDVVVGCIHFRAAQASAAL
jgi:hypothetical protein